MGRNLSLYTIQTESTNPYFDLISNDITVSVYSSSMVTYTLKPYATLEKTRVYIVYDPDDENKLHEYFYFSADKEKWNKYYIDISGVLTSGNNIPIYVKVDLQENIPSGIYPYNIRAIALVSLENP